MEKKSKVKKSASKSEANNYAKNIQLAKDIIAKKKRGVVYILETKETENGTQTQGMCMVQNVKHHVLIAALMKAFQLDPAEVMAAALFSRSKDL